MKKCEKYKMCGNKLDISLKLAKQNNYYSQLENEKESMKNTWKYWIIFFDALRKRPCRKFINNGVSITDHQQIANEFNQYFANVCHSLASRIKYTGKDFNLYLQNSNKSTWFFKPENEEENSEDNQDNQETWQ